MPAEFWAAWKGSACAVLDVSTFLYHICSSIVKRAVEKGASMWFGGGSRNEVGSWLAGALELMSRSRKKVVGSEISPPSLPSLNMDASKQLHLIHSTTMSAAAKATLAATTVGTIGIVLLVHRQQKLDQAVCFTSCPD